MADKPLQLVSDRPDLFGLKRTTCACDSCTTYCLGMPGYLLPEDLYRIVPEAVDVFSWAREHLRASPGSIAAATDDSHSVRVGKLVPASTSNGYCHWLDTSTPDKGCRVHQYSPVGCAYFGCNDVDAATLQQARLSIQQTLLAEADKTHSLYVNLWNYLYLKGLTTFNPLVSRLLVEVNAHILNYETGGNAKGSKCSPRIAIHEAYTIRDNILSREPLGLLTRAALDDWLMEKYAILAPSPRGGMCCEWWPTSGKRVFGFGDSKVQEALLWGIVG